MTLLTEITIKKCSTVIVEIFIGGDVSFLKNQLALCFADIGMCASVDETEFVYTGGLMNDVLPIFLAATIRASGSCRVVSRIADLPTPPAFRRRGFF